MTLKWTRVTLPPKFDPGYCQMAGHPEQDCPDFGTPEHTVLIRLGYGISRIPGPTDAELREETRADSELMASEFHGRDIDGSIRW